jgi:hypothetical protein
MSRLIQIGDYVPAKIGKQEYYLSITDIRSTDIVAGDHNIIPVGNRWMVRDYPIEHIIRFIMGPPLPTYPEITSQILLTLNYKDLINACRTNRDFNKVCQDDYFWRLKVEHDYGMLTQYKPPNITHYQQYIDLMTTDDPNQAAREGRLDLLQWLAGRGVYAHQYIIDDVAENGHLEVLKWLAQTENIYPSQYGANYAAENGHLGVLKWLAETKKLYPDQKGTNYAAVEGRLEVLKWLAQIPPKGIYPEKFGANSAAANGHLEVLKWLAQIPPKGIYPDLNGANYAAGKGHLNILKWLAEHNIYPNQVGADLAIKNGQTEVSKWLSQPGNIYLDQNWR